MRTRREALALLHRALVLGALCAVAPPLGWAAERWDVLYFDWTPDLDEARDQLGSLEESVLDPEDVARLQIVTRAAGGYGVVLRIDGTAGEATARAAAHAGLLAEAAGSDEVLARPVATAACRKLYNVSYGLGPNFDALKGQWDTVARMLGSGVAKALYVERTDKGNFALVYKRYGDLEGTRIAALRHDRLLRGSGVRAAPIEERNNEIVWTGSSARRPPTSIDGPGGSRRAVAPTPGAPAESPTQPEPRPEPPAPAPEPPAPAPGPGALPGDAVASDAPGARSPEPEQPTPSYALLPGTTALQAEINAYIQGLRKDGRVASDEQTSWLVYDLATDVGLADIHGEVPRQAASMIKPLVMLAFFHRVEAEELDYDDVARGQLEAMIQRSSNPATNWAIDRLGGPERVNALLRRHYGALLPETMVVEKIAAGGRTYRNRASARDYARYLRAAWQGALPRSSEMLRILNLPGRDRLFFGAASIPVGTEVYDKTGSTAMLCGDMGILVARRRTGGNLPYIVVGIIEKQSCTSRYSTWIGARSGVIRGVSDLAYRHLKALHDLA